VDLRYRDKSGKSRQPTDAYRSTQLEAPIDIPPSQFDENPKLNVKRVTPACEYLSVSTPSVQDPVSVEWVVRQPIRMRNSKQVTAAHSYFSANLEVTTELVPSSDQSDGRRRPKKLVDYANTRPIDIDPPPWASPADNPPPARWVEVTEYQYFPPDQPQDPVVLNFEQSKRFAKRAPKTYWREQWTRPEDPPKDFVSTNWFDKPPTRKRFVPFDAFVSILPDQPQAPVVNEYGAPRPRNKRFADLLTAYWSFALVTPDDPPRAQWDIPRYTAKRRNDYVWAAGPEDLRPPVPWIDVPRAQPKYFWRGTQVEMRAGLVDASLLPVFDQSLYQLLQPVRVSRRVANPQDYYFRTPVDAGQPVIKPPPHLGTPVTYSLQTTVSRVYVLSTIVTRTYTVRFIFGDTMSLIVDPVPIDDIVIGGAKTFSFQIRILPTGSGMFATKVWFAIKRREKDSDSSLIFKTVTSTPSADGQLTDSGAATETIIGTLILYPADTIKLAVAKYKFSYRALMSDGLPYDVVIGDALPIQGVIRATS
jgi:hypothetical protein